MRESVLSAVEVCLQPHHLRQTLGITLFVGTWLTFYNQGNILASGHPSPAIMGKIVLNYLTPFVVSNWGLISREPNTGH